jgi:hypothetical protein
MRRPFLRSSNDRVGWFTRFDEYFEFSLDGKQIGHYEGPSRNVLSLIEISLALISAGRTMPW